MIQISSPTQGPSPSQENTYRMESGVVEGNGVNSAGNSPVFARAQKKNRPGVFAKLLEGLTVKLKMGGPGSEASVIEKASPERVEKNTLKNVSNTKKTRDFSFGMDIPNREGLTSEFLAVFMQDSGAERLQTGLEDLLPQQKGRELHLARQNSLREMTPKEDLQDLSARRSPKAGENGAEKHFSDLESLERHLFGAEKDQPVHSGEKAKSARNASFVNTSSREMEAEPSQNQSLHVKAGLESGQIPQGRETENARFPDARGKKSRERLNIEVRDLRTGEGRSPVLAENAVGLREAGGMNPRPVSTVIEIPVDLNLFEGRGEGAGMAAGKAGDSVSRNVAFEDALAAQLRGNLSTDIVRDAMLIIRNGGEGTIRLSLRPASLGDVKIRLEMTENKITGHIILESNEALRAFERELPVLEKAFRDSGFSETNLEMFLAQDDRNYGGQRQGQEGDFLTQVMAAARYEAELDSVTNRLEALSGSGELVQSGMGLPSSPGRTPVNLLV